MIKNLKPGAEVAVVERDENEKAVDASTYMFIDQVGKYVICSPFIYELGDAEDTDANETLAYYARTTAADYDTKLYVFPADDCYSTLPEAEKFLALETDTECEENA